MFRARKEALRAVAGGLKSQKRTLFKMPNYNYRNFGIAPLYSRAVIIKLNILKLNYIHL